MGSIVLGIDASGARCGFALVSGEQLGPRLLWQTTVHATKCDNSYVAAISTYKELSKTLLLAYGKSGLPERPEGIGNNLIVAIEDPTAFAYATALHHTSKTTNAAAVFGFPWMVALAMVAINDTWAMKCGIHPVYSYQPSQWQSRLGVKDFMVQGIYREKLDLVFDPKRNERSKKDIIRAVVATVFSSDDLMETRLLRSGRHDWVVEQDGVDAAGIAYVGLREHLFGAPASKAKKKRSSAVAKLCNS
jgi:hypothetical protein